MQWYKFVVYNPSVFNVLCVAAVLMTYQIDRRTHVGLRSNTCFYCVEFFSIASCK